MFYRLAVLFSLGLTTLAFPAAAATDPLPPASQWIPPEAIVVLEVPHPGTLLDLVFDPEVVATVAGLPAYQNATSERGFREFLGVIRYLEARLGTDWQSGLRKLLGGGVTLAVLPDDAVLLIVDAKDGKMLEQLHEILLTFARDEAEKQGDADRVRSVQYRGVTGWTFGDEAHAIVGSRLLMSNKPDVLKRVVDLRAEPDASALASLPTYQAAKRAASSDAAALLVANMTVIKQHPPLHKALTEGGNPLVALLFAGVTEAVADSSWLTLDLHVDGHALALEAAMDGQPSATSGVAAFTLPQQADQGAMPLLSVPRMIGQLSLYRDLHKFYAAKDELFPERTSGLIFFENMMGIFFSGRDLTEEVLAETRPEIRFVVAQQQYDPDIGTPAVQIPAFAAVLRVRDPKMFGEVAEEAWQKALGLINFTRGQQGLPGLIIDRPTYAGVTFTAAHFSSSDVSDRAALDTHFNFQPALVMLDDCLILSSAEGLARDLIDAVRSRDADTVKPASGTHSLVEVNGARLASILKANQAHLVRQNMVEKGHTQEQAEAETDVLLAIVQYLGQVQLQVATENGRSRAELRVQLNLP